VRLAELVASLSLGIDLGFGQPMEHVLRQCLIAMRLAERVGLGEDDRATVYYTSMLINVGCHSDAHEQAKWFGDDIVMKSHKYDRHSGSLGAALAMLRQVGSGNPPLHRVRVGVEFAMSGFRQLDSMIIKHGELARRLAAELRLPVEVQDGVVTAYEHWDGNGWPGELGGEEIPIAARLAAISEYVEVAHRVEGNDGARALLEERGGSQFDPHLCDALSDAMEELLGDLDDTPSWSAVIAAEPKLAVTLGEDQFDESLTAIADFVDLKSPYTLGHSRAVSALMVGAGETMSLPESDLALLRRTGLVFGYGRLGVSNSIWDKAGPLGSGERERVRMHPYLTERMLRQSPALAPLGAIAVEQRERLDGSGYPRGLVGAAISPQARVLGAADAYQTKREPRPHRDALSPADAAAYLRDEVRAGRLDGDCAEAVLAAAGHRPARRREGPAGLTSREIDVLRLLSRGLSAKEIAASLVISPKTARNHIEHIYAKIGTNNRASASLFAVQHGLIPVDEPVAS
jgi:HD-GYP domain-containing protein (c-di-GMP phosphodiesterase class II)